MEKKIIKYRGVLPATIVTVLEGDGKEFPFEEVQYVIVYETVGGIQRQFTRGKIVPLTQTEKDNF